MAMGKGDNQRSNREAKKPKKDKPVVASATSFIKPQGTPAKPAGKPAAGQPAAGQPAAGKAAAGTPGRA